MLISRKNTNKNVSLAMLSRSGKQKIQSLTIKTRLSQLPGGRIYTCLPLQQSALHSAYTTESLIIALPSTGQQLI